MTVRKRKRAEGRESYAKSKSSKVNKRRKKENLEQLHLVCVCLRVYVCGLFD